MSNLTNLTKYIKNNSWLIILFAIFIFSVVLDLYVLTRNPLSYGIDGPFYDIHVLNVIKTGFPDSNDPPLVYYLLTPFVLIIGNSFLGIKIGMSLISSLMVFPAFFLTETFSRKTKLTSKIPALLSAFLITFNIYYFSMIGNLMQNLVGTPFLLLSLYFAVRWLENIHIWKKYGILTLVLLILGILTHIYTGLLAVVLFIALLFFDVSFKTWKTRKVPGFEVKILLLLGGLITGSILIMFFVYPVYFSKFTAVLSFFNASEQENLRNQFMGQFMGNGMSFMVFLTMPYLLGIYAVLKEFYKGFKEKISIENGAVISSKTLLSWSYIVIALTLFVLITLPTVSADYKWRFLMLSFVPIALIVPLGLKLIEKWLSQRISGRKNTKKIIVGIIAVIFALSSFSTAAENFSTMGPTITIEQYQEMVKINQTVDDSGTIITSGGGVGGGMGMLYWSDYVYGDKIESMVNMTDKTNHSSYAIVQKQDNKNGFFMGGGGFMFSEISWNPLLPYGPSIINISDNRAQQHGPHFKTLRNMTLGNGPPQNQSFGNGTRLPQNQTFGNGFPAPPDNLQGNAQNGMQNVNSLQNWLEEIVNQGELIYNGKYYQLYKL